MPPSPRTDDDESDVTEDFADLLAANRRHHERFDGRDAAKVPTRGLVVLTCMDARVDPWRIFGLDAGDAHTLRNAGGRVSKDVVRSIAISAAALGTRRVAVVHHTDCGMQTPRDELVAALREHGVEAGEADLLTFDDHAEALRDDVERLRTDPMIPDDLAVAAFLYDVTTGEATHISM